MNRMGSENNITDAARQVAGMRKNPGRKPKLAICPKCGRMTNAHGRTFSCFHPLHTFMKKK
jgi:ribosomal protein L32